MLQRFSMQKKLVAALVVMAVLALVAVGWFAIRAIGDARADARAASDGAQVVEAAVVTGDLVDGLQRERGMSVGYVASDGQNFGSQLADGRGQTDAALQALEEQLDDEQTDAGAAEQSLRRGVSQLSELNGTRGQIDSLQVDGGDVAAYYTGVIAELVGGIQAGFAEVADAELAQGGSAYNALIGAKEAAGQTRAQLNGVFTEDSFAPEQVETVGSLIGQQDALLDAFETAASEEMLSRYRDVSMSATFTGIDSFQAAAFDDPGGRGFGIDPQEWFDASSARIEQLHELELAQADELLERADQVASQAGRELTLATVMTSAFLLPLLLIAGTVIVYLRRQVVRPLGDSARSLARSSEGMSAVATQVGSNAEETAAQAGVVASAGEQVSQNVQAVATAVEELTSSISEISQNASDASGVAAEGVEAARVTNESVSELDQASTEIGEVIELISSIAEQTNLLALNATIEAARAGEAGKGFAVVANEVKELAKQTASATEQVGERVTAIQEGTRRSVGSIEEISSIVARISDMQNTIASAVEEQNSATMEIGRNANEAATGASEIAENIASVATAANDTTDGANQTQQAANELAAMAERLDQLVFGAAQRDAAAAGTGAGSAAGVAATPHPTSDDVAGSEPARSQELVGS